MDDYDTAMLYINNQKPFIKNDRPIIGNYGVLTDLNQEFVLDNNFEALFNFRRIGLANNEPFVISIVPISENINNITSDPVVFNFNEIGQFENGSIFINIDENRYSSSHVNAGTR